MTYEEAIQKLDVLSRQMEQGTISIDELTDKLQEAQKLLTFCRERLTKIDDSMATLLETTPPK